MEVKNAAIINPEFTRALNKILKKDLPAKTSFVLFKIAKDLGEQASTVYKVRDKLLSETCTMNGPRPKMVGNQPEFTSEEEKTKFFEQMAELLEEGIELPYNKVKLPEDCAISPEDILLLESILEIE